MMEKAVSASCLLNFVCLFVCKFVFCKMTDNENVLLLIQQAKDHLQ